MVSPDHPSLKPVICGAQFHHNGTDYYCNKAYGHDDYNMHSYSQRFSWMTNFESNPMKTDTGNKALRDEISQLQEENARLEKQNASLESRLETTTKRWDNQRESIIEYQQIIQKLGESKESWIDRYYRRNREKLELEQALTDIHVDAVFTTLRKEKSELETKIKNQAKSLTEMHKAVARGNRWKKRYFALAGSDGNLHNLHLAKERNNNLQKRLDDSLVLNENLRSQVEQLEHSNTKWINFYHHLINVVRHTIDEAPSL